MSSEETQKQNQQDSKNEPEKELGEEELDQASGGLIGLLTPPIPPSVSPQYSSDDKHKGLS